MDGADCMAVVLASERQLPRIRLPLNLDEPSAPPLKKTVAFRYD